VTQSHQALLKEQLNPDQSVPRYELRSWSEQFGVVAGVTAGRGDWDLSLASPDTQTLERWAFLMAAAGTFRAAAVSRQPHGTELGVHGDLPPGVSLFEGLDGHLTDRAGTLLAVTVADCIPIFLLEPGSRTMGILHAGWRGVSAGIVEQGIHSMRQLTGQPADRIVIHCGIGICEVCYQVGPEVLEAVLGPAVTGGGGLDLRAAITARALSLGVETVTVSPRCTAHDPHEFHSHRASGGTAGRMAAYVGRPSG
jgi:copper oxidase (laccase) domain-containing protein